MDFSFAPVGVPLNKEHYQKKDFLTFFSLKVFLKHVSFEDRILFFLPITPYYSLNNEQARYNFKI